MTKKDAHFHTHNHKLHVWSSFTWQQKATEVRRHDFIPQQSVSRVEIRLIGNCQGIMITSQNFA